MSLLNTSRETIKNPNIEVNLFTHQFTNSIFNLPNKIDTCLNIVDTISVGVIGKNYFEEKRMPRAFQFDKAQKVYLQNFKKNKYIDATENSQSSVNNVNKSPRLKRTSMLIKPINDKIEKNNNVNNVDTFNEKVNNKNEGILKTLLAGNILISNSSTNELPTVENISNNSLNQLNCQSIKNFNTDKNIADTIPKGNIFNEKSTKQGSNIANNADNLIFNKERENKVKENIFNNENVITTGIKKEKNKKIQFLDLENNNTPKYSFERFLTSDSDFLDSFSDKYKGHDNKVTSHTDLKKTNRSLIQKKTKLNNTASYNKIQNSPSNIFNQLNSLTPSPGLKFSFPLSSPTNLQKTEIYSTLPTSPKMNISRIVSSSNIFSKPQSPCDKNIILNEILNLCDRENKQDREQIQILKKQIEIVYPSSSYRKPTRDKKEDKDIFLPEKKNRKCFVYGNNNGVFINDSKIDTISNSNFLSKILPQGVYKFRNMIAEKMDLEVVKKDGYVQMDEIKKQTREEALQVYSNQLKQKHKKVGDILNSMKKKQSDMIENISKYIKNK